MSAETFGKKLTRWRETTGLNQSQLARRIGVSANYISNLERDFSPSSKDGKPRPSLEVVDKLARALNVSTSEVRLAAGFAPKDMELPKELKILDFDGFDASDMEEIVNFIRYKRAMKSQKQ